MHSNLHLRNSIAVLLNRAEEDRNGSRLQYLLYSKTRTTAVDWLASLVIFSLISFSTLVNFYYLVSSSNVVQASYPDIYASEKDWMFGTKYTGALNESLFYDFIASDSMQVTTQLINALHGAPNREITRDDNCIARMGQDGGSFYVLCTKLNKTRLPSWAAPFEALTVQTLYLSTPDEFVVGQKSQFIGVMQAYENRRTGWFQQTTMDRLFCTTEQLSRPSPPFVRRTLYTKAHGVLRNVDCTTELEATTRACRVTQPNTEVELFKDGTNVSASVSTLSVLRTTAGTDLIMQPFSSREKVGMMTVAEYVWPIDDCLYARNTSMGWLGVGYASFSLQIPTIALIAKIELIGVVVLIWMVKYKCKLYCVHKALYQSSRLGIYVFLVAQILYATYYEQDVMRSIYSWLRRDLGDWLLWLYIEAVISLTIMLVALLLVRTSVGSSCISDLGCLASVVAAGVAGCVEVIIARTNYLVYNDENGLLSRPDSCDPGFTGCAHPKFNLLYLVVFLRSFLPFSSTCGIVRDGLREVHRLQQSRKASHQGVSHHSSACVSMATKSAASSVT